MKLVKVIALKDHEWAKVARHTGEVYEADTEDIRFDALLVTGLAKRVTEPTPAVDERHVSLPGRYKRRDMRPVK